MALEIVSVGRMDHLGVVAGIIKDLGLVELIDQCLGTDRREEVSNGECIAAMIINGLGFSNRPLTLTPQFFESKAMGQLFRVGVKASHFNRFRLGRALDASYHYGCDMLFAQASGKVCKQEKVDKRFNALDTTNFALTGEYAADLDEHKIEITYGHSKDCRPDLKQVTLEMICCHDGGVPILSQSHDGNASDSKIFRERARSLIESMKSGEGPSYLVADSKLYDKITAE
jgi:transposase